MQLYLLARLGLGISSTVMASTPSCIDRIKSNAARDNIDLTVLPFLSEALTSIANLSENRIPLNSLPTFDNATRIDTHTHPIPSWFRTLQPLAAGRETPSWDPLSHLQFMSQQSIARSILCISTPQANAFPDEKAKTVALARLLNEFSAELVKVYPQRFSWMCVTPLPYVKETVKEVRYAVEELGAVGVGVLTNHEGSYPGDVQFDPLWEYLQERAEKGDGREIVFIHPTDPVIRLDDGTLVNSKPCKYTACNACHALVWIKRYVLIPSSTSPIRSRRILLRNSPCNIQHNGESNNHQVSEPPLARIARCWCLS
jgi:hypothetical protein